MKCRSTCARDYACERADVAWQLRERFEPQLDELQLARLFHDVEMPLVEVLAEMEWHGITIDVEWFASLKERFERERRRVEQEIYAAAGEEFNINSNPKLREILFDKLQSAGAQEDADRRRRPTRACSSNSPTTGTALPVLLMEYREIAKLESTYIDALPRYVHPATRRVHTSFSQTVAATGRLSSSDPNLQNIPIRRELGRDIRRGFIPRRGWMLLAADYSQIELRLLAHLSGDPAFVEAFRAGGDIHRQTAALIFDVPLDAGHEGDARAREDDQLRDDLRPGPARAVAAAQDRARRSEGRSSNAISSDSHRVREYLDSMVEFARQHGYVQTIFNRRRYIPELRDRNFNIRAFGERTAANSPIQGSAADLIKVGDDSHSAALCRRAASKPKMLLQVHDELVFETPPSSSTDLTSSSSTRWSTPPSSRCPSSSTSASAKTGSPRRWISDARHMTAVAPCQTNRKSNG